MYTIQLSTCSFQVRAYDVPFTYFSLSTAHLTLAIIGSFNHFDDSDRLGWAFALHIKVTNSYQKRLRCGVLLKLHSGVAHWVCLYYEHLPRFCDFCGYMGHVQRDYLKSAGKVDVQYGDWLRVYTEHSFQLYNQIDKDNETILMTNLLKQVRGFREKVVDAASSISLPSTPIESR